MFNFIFEGKIGDMLAPVVPTNRLFLAIQHHKNEEVNQLILNNDLQRNADGGYAAIHVACRYNNKFALEMILAKGVPVDSVDQNGNSPLHYACKYGHLDLCKYLIELRASPCRKNSSGETPYDAAGDHHTVRQYMLPLQFQAEREGNGDANPGAGVMGISSDSYYNNNNMGYGQAAAPQQSMPTSYAMPPPQYNAPPAAYYGTPASNMDAAGATGYPSNPSPPAVPGQASFAPPAQFPVSTGAGGPPGGASGSMYNHARPAGTTSRIIQPDGFHTSASDPLLQKKYGHIQQTINIAPPPTGMAPPGGAAPTPAAYSMYGAGPVPGAGAAPPNGAPPTMGAPPTAYGAGVYSRYVPYDAHNNTAAPVPTGYLAPPPAAVAVHTTAGTASSFPSFLGGGRPGLPTHISPAVSTTSAATSASAVPAGPAFPAAATPSSGRTLTANNPATLNAATMGSAATATAVGGGISPVSQFGSGNGTPVSTSAGPSAPNSQRLLGNKALLGGDDLFNSTRSHSGDEEVIITANASSSAVL